MRRLALVLLLCCWTASAFKSDKMWWSGQNLGSLVLEADRGETVAEMTVVEQLAEEVGERDILALSAQARHGALVDSDNTLHFFGGSYGDNLLYETHGSMCVSNEAVWASNGTIVLEEFTGTVVNAIAANSFSVIYTKDDEIMTCGSTTHADFGSTDSSYLGRGDSLPLDILGTVGFGDETTIKVRDMCAGQRHVVVVNDDGEVYTWGHSFAHGSVNETYVPTRIDRLVADKIDIVKVACGNSFTLAISDKGDLWTWGTDSAPLGQNLDNGETSLNPALVGKLKEADVTDIAAGPRHAVAVNANGRLFTWGVAADGVLGQGEEVANLNSPTEVEWFGDRFVPLARVRAGIGMTYAWGKNGTVYAWGNAATGQLGTDSGELLTAPAVVAFWESNEFPPDSERFASADGLSLYVDDQEFEIPFPLIGWIIVGVGSCFVCAACFIAIAAPPPSANGNAAQWSTSPAAFYQSAVALLTPGASPMDNRMLGYDTNYVPPPPDDDNASARDAYDDIQASDTRKEGGSGGKRSGSGSRRKGTGGGSKRKPSRVSGGKGSKGSKGSRKGSQGSRKGSQGRSSGGSKRSGGGSRRKASGGSKRGKPVIEPIDYKEIEKMAQKDGNYKMLGQ